MCLWSKLCSWFVWGGCDGDEHNANVSCPQEYMDQLKTSTTLKPGEIQHLYKRFCLIGKDSEIFPPTHLKKYQFLSIVRLLRNPVLTTILSSMYGDRKLLTFVEFAKYIATFPANDSKTTREQIDEAKAKKCQLLFDMYDHDRDKIINEKDLIYIAHKLYSHMMTPEQIMSVANRAIHEMDSSFTHQVMMRDFCRALEVFDMDEILVTRIPEARMGSF